MYSGARPIIRPSVEFRVLDDLSGLAIDTAGGQAHALNPVAVAILERCDGSLSIQDLVAEVCEIFDAPSERVADDAHTFLEEASALGLIEW